MNEKDTAPVGEVPGPSDDSAVAKWWMAIDDKPQGPHTAAYIALMLKEGRVQPTTLVCQVGKGEWCPLLESAELVAAVETQSPGSLPPVLPAAPGAFQRTAGGFFDRFTNPTLPRFANWICVYCILVVPAFFALYFLFTIGGFSTAAELKPESPLVFHAVAYDVITFVADGALAVVLVLGGLMLRKLQRKGAMLIKVGLTLRLCWGMIELVTSVLWDVLVTLGEQAQPVSEEWTAGTTLMLFVGVPFLVAFLASIVFEIVALVWLIKNDHRLPLKEQAQSQADEEDKP